MASKLNETEFETLEEELNHLKSLFPSDLKVEVRNKNHIISIKVRKSLVLEITVNESYPWLKPISVRLYLTFETNNLKPQRKECLQKFLQHSNETLNALIDTSVGQSCLLKLYNKLCSLFDQEEKDDSEGYLKESFEVLESQSKQSKLIDQPMAGIKNESTKRNPEAKKSNNKHEKDSGDEKSDSKAKLKGSDLIFQRIKWDTNIDKDQIIIGYLDRFLGIKEIKFTDFKGVHEDKEGIPFHRIRHFKINEKIVWDRDNRIDLLTGCDNLDKYFVKPSNEPLNCDIVKKEIKTMSESIQSSAILVFDNEQWVELSEKRPLQPPQFLSDFKLLTYNIMSKNNFTKRLNELNLGFLNQIDRMVPINQLLAENQPHFVLLQECEEHEERALLQSEFVRKNYFVCASSRSGCTILSKLAPIYFKQIKLNENGSKCASLIKVQFRTNSLRKAQTALFVNVHLTSDKSSNAHTKRKDQLAKISELLTLKPKEHDLDADYTFLCGDFNFGDQHVLETQALRTLFLTKQFKDSCDNAGTFDPSTNFSAALTASSNSARRMDRILFKAKNESSFEMVEASLVNTRPIKIEHMIESEMYSQIGTRANKNQVKIFPVEQSFEFGEIEHGHGYLHASDHYGLECIFRFRKCLNQLVHKSTLAIICPKHSSDLIQTIRSKYDPQINRWFPHINILYPFCADISLDVSEDEEASVVGDLLNCLSQFRPFECELNEIKTFNKNNVIYLEPNKEAKQKIQLIYKELKLLFEDKANLKWHESINPHLTIAQPENKRNASKDWCATTLNEILDNYKQTKYGSFTVDCIYWMTRTDQTPFRIKQAFPLGSTYPSTAIGLNPTDLTMMENSLLNFMRENKIILYEDENNKMENDCERLVREISKALPQASEKVSSSIEFESKSSGYCAMFIVGSSKHGIKGNDLDLALLSMASNKEEFVENFTYKLAQNSDVFHVVRHIPNANVPIIELCTRDNLVKSCDIQIFHVKSDESFELTQLDEFHRDKNFFFSNFDYMNRLSNSLSDYDTLFPISGLFENQNIKKYVKHYKDYQVVLSFVKYWAEKRNIYAKAFGFLSGISWSIMVAYFLQKSAENYEFELEMDLSSSRFSSLLSEFFKFYATFNWLEPISLTCNLNMSESRSPIMILQSVFPYHNTSKNVDDYRKKLIIKEFKRANEMLAKEPLNYTDLCQSVTLSSIDSTCLRFEIRYKLEEDLVHISNLIKAKALSLITNIERSVNNLHVRVYPSLFDYGDGELNQKRKSFLIEMIESEKLNESQRQMIYDFGLNFIRSIKSMSYTCNYEILLNIA